MPRDVTPADPPTAAVGAFLEDDSEVLRCAAARALGGLGDASPQVRERLLGALLDPDPDVRADAMEALSGLARPEDAAAIRRSLAGDPVREVKLAAIEALGRLRDGGAEGLLRALVLSRSEDTVAWEDEDSDWEDWLDIQIAAVGALGRIGCADAIPDMLAARGDECAQTLDLPVFEALARLGEAGVSRLLAIVEAETGLAARRAAGVLCKVTPERLAPCADTLLASADPALRTLGAGLLPAGGDAIAHLARSDPSPKVRAAALARAADARPALVVEGLKDRDAGVQAAALRLLAAPTTPETRDAVADNMLAWIETAPPALMTETAAQLAAWAPDRAGPPLLRLARDAARPLEARVAAVRGLARARPAVATGVIADILETPAQQVRTAALVLLRDRAAAGDAAAAETLAKAIAGTLLPEADAAPAPDDDAPDLATPKGDAPGRNHIRITPDGEIVAADGADGDAPESTLSAILAPAAPKAQDTPEERPEKRRKRRAVEGPDDIAAALARETIQIAAGLETDGIEAAILARAAGGDPLRRTAWQALGAGRATSAARREAAVAAARDAAADEDPVIRLAAFKLLFHETDGPDLLATAASDADPLIRAEAVARLPLDALTPRLGDDALPVRCAAVDRLLAEGGPRQVEDAAALLLSAERGDTLARLIGRSAHARARVAATLASGALSKRTALVALDAFARAGRAP